MKERRGGGAKGKAVTINDTASRFTGPHISPDLSSLFLKPSQHFCRSMYLFNRDTRQCDAFSPICSKQSICRTIVIEPSLFLANSVFLYAQTRQKVEATNTQDIHRDLHRSSPHPLAKSGPRYFRFVFPLRIDHPSHSYFHSLARGYKGPVKVKTQLTLELNKAYLNERHNRPFYFA